MNILKGNILKGFAAVAMLCMIGTVLAESVAVGDIGYYVGKKLAGESGSVVGSIVGERAGEYAGESAGLILAETFAEEGAVAGSVAGPVGALGGAVVGGL